NNVTQKTIQNCWNKTGILPFYDNDDDVDEKESELNIDNDEIKDLLNHLPESDDVIEYFQIFDHEIPTEENLTEEEIINLVQGDKENQEAKDDNDDVKIPVVSVKKAVSGLETFINFFEQQNDIKYNNENLHIFRKYLQVVREKEFNSKKQSILDLYLNNCGIE
ncbi:hypothetical protein C1645_693030, partial [Glomus cerebriforme]